MRVKMVATPQSLTPSVKDQLCDVEAKVFKPDEVYPKENSYWWLAYDEDRVVGFAGLKIVPYEKSGFLSRCGVLSCARGKGLQGKFIAARVQCAKRLGLAQVYTYTDNRNFTSANNLIRHGFMLYEPAYKYGLPGAFYFYKELRKRK